MKILYTRKRNKLIQQRKTRKKDLTTLIPTKGLAIDIMRMKNISGRMQKGLHTTYLGTLRGRKRAINQPVRE